MTERDPSLDMALRLLVAEAAPEDDARWAKRTAAGISNWTAKSVSRAEIDALLAAPLPDAHEDEAHGHESGDEEDLEEIEADGDSAASATEHEAQADRGYSISHPPTSKSSPMPSSPPSGLEGLARLTRSGENSARLVSSPATGDDAGQAKGDDSGLIDLRGMSEKPAAREEAAPAVVPVPAATSAAGPSARPIAAVPNAPPSSAVAPPSTMAAQVASTPIAATPIAAAPKKKGGNVVWIALGGLAAAAAVGVFALSSTSSSKPENVSSTKAAAKDQTASDDEPKGKKKVDDPEAVASATATATVAANAEVSASAAPDDNVAVAPTVPNVYGKKVPPTSTGNGTPMATTTSVATKPTAMASASAEPPKPNPSGGSLDDVLGINKPPPPPTATANTPDLPDKPEAADIRVAVNSKVGTANACVKGLDGPSSISVVFSPAVTVASVSVTSGPAKGTGAEACIKSAFSSVKVGRSKLGGTGYAKLLP